MKHITLLLTMTIMWLSCHSQTQKVTEPTPTTNEQVAEPAKPIAQNISVEEAKTMIQNNKDLVILDVRTPGEVSQGTIADAIVIDINDADFVNKVNELAKDKPTLVYCKAGGRSARAMDIMKNNGFQQVYNMMGGYDSYSNK